MEERLQKFLAAAGVASRRQAEQLMLDGRVTVNGKVITELGVKVDPETAAVKVDGKRVHGERMAYVLLFKPKNTICTVDDPEQRPTVMELVQGVKARLYPVGRLDFDTTGALLLTNDGELANMLMHPRHRFTKTYLAKVKGIPTEERLEKLRRGVNIEGVRTAPAEARLITVKEKNSLVELVLREGRNRQVKRMFLEVGHPVIRLHRPAYAFLTLEGLEPGSWRFLTPDEVKRLRSAAARAGEPGGEAPYQARLDKPLKAPRPVQSRSARPTPYTGPKTGERSASGPDRRPSSSKPGEHRSVAARSSDYRPSASKSSDYRPSASKSGDYRPASGGKPAGERRPSSSKPGGERRAGSGGKPGAKPGGKSSGKPSSQRRRP